MPDDEKNVYRYRILRYAPNLIRDEWLNIGVVLEQAAPGDGEAAQPSPPGGPRRAIRVIEDASEMARVRKLHPAADLDLLRALPSEFEARLAAPADAVGRYLSKLDDSLSNILQLGPQKAVYSDDFDAELDRLYREQVALPPRMRSGLVENARGWIRDKLNDVFRRHRVLKKLETRVPVEEFTQPGDPMRLDYAYQNGRRGYLQSILLGREPAQPKVLSFTAERIRARLPQAEFTAITDSEPQRDNARHQFVVKLFEQQNIRIVPLNQVEAFAEELRLKLQ
jgi:Protein of unknown function (DUF3037)